MTAIPWVQEKWTEPERAVLEQYFTSADAPTFALRNLSPAVAAALFARYSRTSLSLRRLFLTEFAPVLADVQSSGAAGEARAAQLLGKVIGEYGDDSVAQLGGAHLACEQVSNIMTKVLERPRLGSYLEQSTRYIDFQARQADGSRRYLRLDRYRGLDGHPALPCEVRGAYVSHMEDLFSIYGTLTGMIQQYLQGVFPASDNDKARQAAIRAKALDATRGLLPAATLSNLGIFASGQTFEGLLIRAAASPLPEVVAWGEMALKALRQVIPDFLIRVDLPERGQRWSSYLADTRAGVGAMLHSLGLDGTADASSTRSVDLIDFDPEAETKLVAAIAYPHSHLSESQLLSWARGLSVEAKAEIILASAGDRSDNRRHRPGRAWEAPVYRFDVVCDYGAFRDLQRHRLCEIEWQQLSPVHGYDIPELVEAAKVSFLYRDVMDRSAELYDQIAQVNPALAPYAVSLGYLCRFRMTMNAREAMHVLELRSGPQGHPSYRAVAQQMHDQIAQVAGHHAIAAAMEHVDHSDGASGRLDAEIRLAAKQARNA